jgi:hypothetical protein
MTAIISAAISMGSITPVDSFAPNIIAIKGTMERLSPLSPALDIPITSATVKKIIRYPGVRLGFNDRRSAFIYLTKDIRSGANI